MRSSQLPTLRATKLLCYAFLKSVRVQKYSSTFRRFVDGTCLGDLEGTGIVIFICALLLVPSRIFAQVSEVASIANVPHAGVNVSFEAYYGNSIDRRGFGEIAAGAD